MANKVTAARRRAGWMSEQEYLDIEHARFVSQLRTYVVTYTINTPEIQCIQGCLWANATSSQEAKDIVKAHLVSLYSAGTEVIMRLAGNRYPDPKQYYQIIFVN